MRSKESSPAGTSSESEADAPAASSAPTAGDAEAFLRGVLAASPVYIMRISDDLRILYANRLDADVRPEDIYGKHVFDFLAAEDRAHAERCYQRVRDTGLPASYEVKVHLTDALSRIYECQVAPMLEHGERVAFVVAAVDVTERRAKEVTLVENEARLRLAVEASGIATWSWDLRTQEVEWSEQMHSLCGVDTPLAGLAYSRIVHPDDRERVEREMHHARLTGKIQSVPHRIVRPDGSVRWALAVGTFLRNDAGEITKVVGGSIDVTPQRVLEEHLRHAQKAEAIGQLAAGIAHNFNNMLAAILPVLDMARPFMPRARLPVLDDALHAGQRAAEMVRQLLTFAGGRNAPAQRAHDVLIAVRRAYDIAQRLFGPRIHFTLSTECKSAHVICDAGQLEQAVLNLMLNARDAVLEAQRETPEIRVQVTYVEDEPIALWSNRPHPACHVRIRVEDNGVGMDEQVARRAFEPFFTTKEPGKGTGLGLATAYAIAKDHGGTLSCLSRAGEGAVFDLCLPVVERPSLAAPLLERDHAPRGRGELIMVVDDEATVRDVTALLLEDAGYLTCAASTTSEAVTGAAEHAELRLILLDRSLLGADPVEAVRQIRAARPVVSIAYFVGEPPPEHESTLVQGVLLKPFTSRELLGLVNDLLHGTPTLGRVR